MGRKISNDLWRANNSESLEDSSPFKRVGNVLSNNRLIVIGLILCILLTLLITMAYTAPVHRWGDSSTYYMQISSISEDYDIEYRPEDIQRAINNKFDDLPAGLYMIKTDDGRYYYGKEYSYALFAAPLYSLLGVNGILVFNAFLFWLMILMGYLHLRRTNTDLIALCLSSAFFLISTAFVYIFWIHPEVYNMFLITAGIFFWLTYRHKKDYRFLYISLLIIGIATVAKLPNCLIFMPIVCYELIIHFNKYRSNSRYKKIIAGDPRKFGLKYILLFGILVLLPVILFYGFFYINTDAKTFYGGDRLYYVSDYPFVDGYDSVNEPGKPAFSVEEGRLSALIIDLDNANKIFYNIFYYFFGRFTGMIWYYPFALFALLSLLIGFVRLLDKPFNFNNLSDILITDKEKYLLLLGIILNIAFFIVIIGNNYLGGMHAVGNRYFYVYPAFIFLLGFVDPKKLLALSLIALVFITPVFTDPINVSATPLTLAYSFPQKFAPIEYSQMNNLPFWGKIWSFDEALVIQIDDHSSYYQGMMSVSDGTAEFLIRPRVDPNTIGLMVYSYYDDTSHVSIMPFSDMEPAYQDNMYSIYKVSISSSGTTWIKPINLMNMAPLQFNTPIIFGQNGTAQQYQLTGWSHPEEGFTWTSGYQAGLALQMED
ncbi:hypothetical protein D5R95_08780, partial [Methanosalsum natronophilum]